jgi:HAD superfamily hydrolase (TIGR01662 family)
MPWGCASGITEMSTPDRGLTLHPAPQLWLFDFDNTLVALEETVDWSESRRELEPMLRAAGCPPRLFEEFPRGNLLLYDAIRRGLEAQLFTPTIPARDLLQRASNIIEYHELAGVDRAQPLPGAIDLLSELVAHRIPVAIVTSNSSRTAVRWLARARLVHAVRIVVGRDTLLALKPAPDMIRRALEHCKATAGDALFVGDSEADLKAAKAAGVRFFAIAPSSERRARMSESGAAAAFSSPAELLAALRTAPA